jgi:hypothetical protein
MSHHTNRFAIVFLFVALVAVAQPSLANEWAGTSSAASSQLSGWEHSKLIDGNPSTSWSSNGYGDANHAESFTFWFTSQSTNYVRLFPRTASGVSWCVPTSIDIHYWANGQWNFVKTMALPEQLPTEGLLVYFPGGAVTTDGIRISTSTLRPDSYGNYYFQLAEAKAGNMNSYSTSLSWKGRTWEVHVSGPGQVYVDANSYLHLRLEGHYASYCGSNNCVVNVISEDPLLWYHRYETTVQDLAFAARPPASGSGPSWFPAPLWFAKHPWEAPGEIDFEIFYWPAQSALWGRIAEFMYHYTDPDPPYTLHSAQACWDNWVMSSFNYPIRNTLDWFQDAFVAKTYVNGSLERSLSCSAANAYQGATGAATILDEADGMHAWITNSIFPTWNTSDSPGDMVVTDFQATPITTPLTAVDSPANNATIGQSFNVSGWSIDRGSPSGPGVSDVHLWAHPVAGGSDIFVGYGYGGSRSDVAAAFGASRFTNSGYSISGSLSPGVYDLVIFAFSTVSNSWNSTVRRVTVN